MPSSSNNTHDVSGGGQVTFGIPGLFAQNGLNRVGFDPFMAAPDVALAPFECCGGHLYTCIGVQGEACGLETTLAEFLNHRLAVEIRRGSSPKVTNTFQDGFAASSDSKSVFNRTICHHGLGGNSLFAHLPQQGTGLGGQASEVDQIGIGRFDLGHQRVVSLFRHVSVLRT